MYNMPRKFHFYLKNKNKNMIGKQGSEGESILFTEKGNNELHHI